MSNRLAGETSPYLQQHADNPVEWYPWGEEALARARKEDKPILLSVGYSACHWCHVMAHESFEDPNVAAIMNRHFVNVKVDREERPDLDQIYQTAHQIFNRRPGGWPLTAFLAPDQTPFFVGTYFPKGSRYNLPGFPEVLEHIAKVWRERRDDVIEQNASVREAFASMDTSGAPGDALSADVLARAAEAMKANFDPHYGGFGGAPKFPHPTDIEFLMRRYAATGDADALHTATFTLEQMALGGIHDQIGGGFCRYSVDERWEIPHFEKMLYDNGQLLALYADAWAVTGNELFARVVEATVGWTLREMQSEEGGYYSSLDADSEHEEGKFYVWTPDEVRALLTADEDAVAAPHWGLDGRANFEGAHWHLHVARPLADVARSVGRNETECAALLASARNKLFAARESRIRPGRDDKVLASWNALAIRGMARAARVFDRPDWLASARRAFEFIRTTLYRDGRLLATYKDGRAHLNAYLDDYAYLLDAMLELVQCEYRSDDLAFARELADTLLAQFEDRDAGGFFFTSHDHEPLLQRPKTPYDNATPAGNGVAAFALQRLGHLLGEARYLDAARRAIHAFYGRISHHPGAFGSFLKAVEESLEPTAVIVLRGDGDSLSDWRTALGAEYRPQSFVVAVASTEAATPEALAKPLVPNQVNAYVCQGVTCLAPVQTITELRAVSKPARIH